MLTVVGIGIIAGNSSRSGLTTRPGGHRGRNHPLSLIFQSQFVTTLPRWPLLISSKPQSVPAVPWRCLYASGINFPLESNSRVLTHHGGFPWRACYYVGLQCNLVALVTDYTGDGDPVEAENYIPQRWGQVLQRSK